MPDWNQIFSWQGTCSSKHYIYIAVLLSLLQLYYGHFLYITFKVDQLFLCKLWIDYSPFVRDAELKQWIISQQLLLQQIYLKNSKWAWSGNTTITKCRQNHSTARNASNICRICTINDVIATSWCAFQRCCRTIASHWHIFPLAPAVK